MPTAPKCYAWPEGRKETDMATPIGNNDKGGQPPAPQTVWGPDGGLRATETDTDPVLQMAGINRPVGMTPGHVNAENRGNKIKQ